ncbi:MAG: CBS domain-containing protein [Gammaproteobacteria bacterium]|nr:CBS domain-containing protein [Gammaproteobacteria bacterium]
METIGQLLKDKGPDVWTIGPDASVYDGIEMMAAKGVGALVGTDGGRPVGIISERDYARKVVLKDRSSRDTKIAEIMTGRVLYASPDQTVEEGLSMMTEKRVRHLPVMDGEKLVGIVSIGDLVKAIIAEQQQMISQLEQYISG